MFGAQRFGWRKHPGYNGKGGGGSGGGTQTVNQKADPWAGVQPYLTKAYADSEKLYNQSGPQYYPGQTYVGLDPYQTLGRNMQLGYAMNGMGNDINQIRGAYGDLLKSADVSNNPFLEPAITAAIRPTFDMLNEQALPAIRSGAIGAGSVGGSREGIAQGLATKAAIQSAMDTGASMANSAYGQGLDSLTKAMLFGPQMLQLAQAPAQTIEAYGAGNQAEVQKALSENMARWDYAQNLPYQKLSNWMQTLQGAPWGSSSTSSMTPASYGGNSLAGALGGGMLGYQLGNMVAMPQFLGGGFATMGPIGAGLGALAGLLMN